MDDFDAFVKEVYSHFGVLGAVSMTDSYALYLLVYIAIKNYLNTPMI